MPAGAPFAVVAATGGHHATVQAAIDDGAISIFVRAGFSGAGFNMDQADVEVETGPGVTFTSGINITGNKCSFIGGPGCDVQGEIDISTGVEGYVEFMNGGDIDGIDINTARCYVNGGGWGTVSDGDPGNVRAVDLAGADTIVENMAGITQAANTGNVQTLRSTGTKACVRLFKVNDADKDGLQSQGADTLLLGCISVIPTSLGLVDIEPTEVRTRIIGCASPNDNFGGALVLVGTADDSIVTGSVFNDPVTIASGATNCAVVGNRSIGNTITDSGTDSTVAANDET